MRSHRPSCWPVLLLLAARGAAPAQQTDLVIATKPGLSIDALRDLGLEPRDAQSAAAPAGPGSALSKNTVLSIVLDPAKRLTLPEGWALGPKRNLKEQLSLVRGRLVEEKLSVLLQSGIALSPQQREAIISCQGALRRFESARLAYSVSSTANPIVALADLLKTEQELEDRCMQPVTDVDRIRSFGVLETPKGGIVCGALLLSSTRIVTAYHCLVRTDAAFESMRFRPASDPTLSIQLVRLVLFPGQADLAPDQSGRLENDFLGADLQDPVPSVPPLCMSSSATTGDPLALVAYWPSKAPTATFQGSVREETSGGCRLLASTSACFIHSCSAIHGQSGSPIFAPANAACPGAVVVGLHVGGTSFGSDACSTSQANTAVASARLQLIGQ